MANDAIVFVDLEVQYEKHLGVYLVYFSSIEAIVEVCLAAAVQHASEPGLYVVLVLPRRKLHWTQIVVPAASVRPPRPTQV